ncbi:MAG: type II secretion system protein [Minisyncoccia bacterium]
MNNITRQSRGFTQSRTSESKGFTLIELLVVIAIIGILSSVVLASLGSARQKGRDARRLSDVKQLQLALELWYDANGSEYPDALSSLATTYIASVPVDPGTSQAYPYQNLATGDAACGTATGVCTSYVLGATLEGTVPTGDVDGTVGPGGDQVSCADPVFCARP